MTKGLDKNCVVTYLYPNCERYLKNFILNLESQSIQNFEVLFFCDNYSFNKKKFKTKLNFKCFKIKGKIPEIRYKSLHKISKLNYSKIYFCDVDDIYKINRLEILSKLLDKNKVVFNDFDCINKKNELIKKNYFFFFFKNNKIINSKNLYHQNFLGFGNTAIKNDILKKINFLNLKKNVYPYDWYIFSYILIEYEARFTNKTKTYYKINSKSFTRLPIKLTSEYLAHSAIVKFNFYNNMKRHGKIYEKMYLKYLDLIKNKTKFSKLKKFIILNNKKTNFSWWGGIKL